MFKTKRKLLKEQERKLANEQAKVKNRDILIDNLLKTTDELKDKNLKLSEENIYLLNILKEIDTLNTSNHYNNDEVFRRKINELVETAINKLVQ